LFGFVFVPPAAPTIATRPRAGFASLSLIVVKQPLRAAQFHVNPDGTFRYLPLSGFNGVDEFQFKVNDGYEDSNTLTVKIWVGWIPASSLPVTHYRLQRGRGPDTGSYPGLVREKKELNC